MSLTPTKVIAKEALCRSINMKFSGRKKYSSKSSTSIRDNSSLERNVGQNAFKYLKELLREQTEAAVKASRVGLRPKKTWDFLLVKTYWFRFPAGLCADLHRQTYKSSNLGLHCTSAEPTGWSPPCNATLIHRFTQTQTRPIIERNDMNTLFKNGWFFCWKYLPFFIRSDVVFPFPFGFQLSLSHNHENYKK